MKKMALMFIVSIMMTIGFGSCKLNSESNYTPRITLLNPALINTDSTLKMSYTAEGNIKFDSLHVNDTVTISVIGNGVVNNLTKFNFSVTEPADIDVIIPDSVKTYFDPSSDFTNGKLVFPKKIVWMNIPFKFVAKQPRDKVKINLLLESDAVSVGNVSSMQLEFPIKPHR